MSYQPPMKKLLQSTLDTFLQQNLTVALSDQNEESHLGGSFTGEDRIRSRLQARDNNTTTSTARQYGIRSIPTLMF